MMREIIFLKPAFTYPIWGGTKLRDDFCYDIEKDNAGECWGISANESGCSVVSGGSYDGARLSELWDNHRELFGNIDGERFPLLVKIIDAKDKLSIQVHPDDAYAKEHENGSLGKTECWYILDCPKNATLTIGHNAMSKGELSSMIKEGRWDDLLRKVSVKKGDFVQIDPGTVHAINEGLTILETQQNSDITYRVYDYDRLDNNKPRELHIRQSLDVITVPAKPADDYVFSVSGGKYDKKNELVELIACKYYRTFILRVDGEAIIPCDYPFLNMSVVEGRGAADTYLIKKGSHFIIPSGYGSLKLSGEMEIIASTVG